MSGLRPAACGKGTLRYRLFWVATALSLVLAGSAELPAQSAADASDPCRRTAPFFNVLLRGGVNGRVCGAGRLICFPQVRTAIGDRQEEALCFIELGQGAGETTVRIYIPEGAPASDYAFSAANPVGNAADVRFEVHTLRDGKPDVSRERLNGTFRLVSFPDTCATPRVVPVSGHFFVTVEDEEGIGVSVLGYFSF